MQTTCPLSVQQATLQPEVLIIVYIKLKLVEYNPTITDSSS